MADRAYVRNAADAKQVARAGRMEQRRQAAFEGALLSVMRTREGRLVMWQLIANAGVFQSIAANNPTIHYNAGRQDFGHDLMKLLRRVDDDLYDQMGREARQLERYQDREVEAAHTAPATDRVHTADTADEGET